MAYLKNKQFLILKTEGATPGTPVTPDASNFDVRVYELERTPTVEMDGDLKYATGDHSEGPDIPGTHMGGINCVVKCGNSGSAGTEPKWFKFAEASGAFFEDITTVGSKLTPLAKADVQTYTAWLVEVSRDAAQVGIAYKYAGVMGEWSIGCAGLGKPLQAAFNFTGKYVASADLDNSATNALAALTGEDTTIPYRMLNYATTTFGSDTLKISSWLLTAGNAVEPQLCQTEASGFEFFGITDRKPRFQCNPLIDTVSNLDILGDWAAGTTAVFTLVTGDTIPFSLFMPAAQIISAADAAAEGLRRFDLNFKLQRNGVTGTPINSDMPVEAPWEILIGARS